MIRTVVLVCAVCAALVVPRAAVSARYYGFSVGTANAPPPPVIRQIREPHALLAGDAMVYVVDDATFRFDGDLFHYGQYWFAYSHGFWYRARSHRGPYAVLDVRKVPRAIIGVPRKLWKHHPLAEAPGRANSGSTSAGGQKIRAHEAAKPASAPVAVRVTKAPARHQAADQRSSSSRNTE